jgi:hypothetical protein
VKQDYDESSTGVNLLWNGAGGNVFAIPRLAIDGFVGPQVTLGGSVGYISRSGTSKTSSVTKLSSSSSSTSTSTDDDLPDVSAFALSPRLGVVVTLGPKVALWLRGGVTYFQTSVESKSVLRSTNGDPNTTTQTKTETSGTALTLDAQLVIVPVDHVGITIGPVFDVGLDGSTKTTSTTTTPATGFSSAETDTAVTDGDLKQSNYGVAAGLIAFF